MVLFLLDIGYSPGVTHRWTDSVHCYLTAVFPFWRANYSNSSVNWANSTMMRLSVEGSWPESGRVRWRWYWWSRRTLWLQNTYTRTCTWTLPVARPASELSAGWTAAWTDRTWGRRWPGWWWRCYAESSWRGCVRPRSTPDCCRPHRTRSAERTVLSEPSAKTPSAHGADIGLSPRTAWRLSKALLFPISILSHLLTGSSTVARLSFISAFRCHLLELKTIGHSLLWHFWYGTFKCKLNTFFKVYLFHLVIIPAPTNSIQLHVARNKFYLLTYLLTLSISLSTILDSQNHSECLAVTTLFSVVLWHSSR